MEYWLRLTQFVFQVVCALFAFAAFLYSYVGQKERATKRALAELEHKVQQHLTAYETRQASNHRANQDSLRQLEVRIERVDESLKHAPTNSDITNLAQSVSLIATTVAELKGAVSATTRTVERMNQYLMERSS